ncbi:MAG: methyltransferase domain-containing protein [Bacteroidia bacterium]
MHSVLNLFSTLSKNEITYEKLGELTRSIDVHRLDFSKNADDYEKSEASDYYRDIKLLDPLEVAVLYWPPEAASAIHFHSGFYGYVLVLDGEGENIEFSFKEGKLKQLRTLCCRKGGIMNEPDGTIHLIRNSSTTNALITLHIYYPALENLDGLTLFDPVTKNMGTLNEKAANASFREPKENFKYFRENAFVFEGQNAKGNSHFVYPILPKPSSEEISEMLQSYYNEQAKEYDSFDTQHQSRTAYTRAINKAIADDFENLKPKMVLDIAGGTGRRSEEIRDLCSSEFGVSILDMSESMVQEAIEKGFEGIHSTYLDHELRPEYYDACYFLYAFGHVPNSEERFETLRKIYKELKTGGRFYFDVFNIENKNEWGVTAKSIHYSHGLNYMGYDEGDVFYKKDGGNAVAYLHYFHATELEHIIQKIGFKIVSQRNIGYVKNAGEWTDNPAEGNLFYILEK